MKGLADKIIQAINFKDSVFFIREIKKIAPFVLEYKSSKYFLPLWNTKTKDFLT
jgi:hypothetical protein